MTTFELQKLDEEISRIPASPVTDHDFDLRAKLMARRGQLDQQIRAAAAAAANSRHQRHGNLVVNVPDGAGISHFFGTGGRVCQARMTEDGRVVLDLFLDEFRTLLSDRHHGLAWQKANPEAVRQMGDAR
jgi:hypothetical protein